MFYVHFFLVHLSSCGNTSFHFYGLRIDNHNEFLFLRIGDCFAIFSMLSWERLKIYVEDNARTLKLDLHIES